MNDDRNYSPALYPRESVNNLRDLGGRPAFEGRPIKKGLLFRSAQLYRLNDRDLDFLTGLHIGLVVDFRDLDEREAHPDRLPPGAEYRHLPALPLTWATEDVPDSSLLPQLFQSDMHRFFLTFYRILGHSADTAAVYAEFFRLLLQEPVRPVLWHCTQGKDRTGLAAILLQTALGVSWEGCLEDYFLTNHMIRDSLEVKLASCESPEQRERCLQLHRVHRDRLDAWQEQLAQRWGGLDKYLEQALGLGPPQLEKLRRLYLD